MVKISVDGDDKAVGTKLFVTPDLWENGKAKGKSTEANRDKRATEGGPRPAHQPLPPHPPGRGFRHRREMRNAFLGVGVMENCILKDFGNMNREFEAMVEKGQRAKSTYNKYPGCLQPFQDLPLGEEEAHRHGLQRS